MTDEEDSYLMVPSQKERVWCKINDAGELEYVHWPTVEMLTAEFDATHPDRRTEQMLIAKLMFLVRKQTREEMKDGNN
jgi:hypothetical protein